MPDIRSALKSIADDRGADPLAPITVIVPSHAAGLQMRRRLAELRPFAGVRFETLTRLAELLGAGELAAIGRAPLARPIGDYVAAQVALESRGTLAQVCDLPGYARALRRIFQRLRRGGIRAGADVQGHHDGHLDEILRLFDLYRWETKQFYDEEDLLDAAASVVRSRRAGALADLGDIYAMPPGARSAGAAELLAALEEVAPRYVEIDEAVALPQTRFILAPDPASEAREVVREVLVALEGGVSLHEVAVFHGADASYSRLLREAFAAAKVPAVPLPGIPLIETPSGRGVLSLALLPERDFSRTATMDVLSVAPLRERLAGRDGAVETQTTVWDRISRKAGITHGADRWFDGLNALIADCDERVAGHEHTQDDARLRAARYERDQATRLLSVIEPLIERLAPFDDPQPAASFIKAFKEVVSDYFDPAAPLLGDVLAEIDQLGTVGAVGGSFSLSSFAKALGANLEAACVRPRSLGDGVIVADYRTAAGLEFKQVVLCGAYEGSLPAGPGNDALIDDRTWENLRQQHQYVEDAWLRTQRANEAASRAAAAAGGGTLVWSAPLNEAGGTREHYPSPVMVSAAAARIGRSITASELRRQPGSDWLSRAASPLAVMLRGSPVDASEIGVRQAILRQQRGERPDPAHPHWRALSMLRARRSSRFTEWEGNLVALADDAWLELQRSVSPTSLEKYALCGFQYLCQSLLRLSVVEEPEEREMIDPAAKGTLIHGVLEEFFGKQKDRGRPRPGEAWTDDDLALLIHLTAEALVAAKRRGLTGLDVYSDHEARTMRADMAGFLEADTAFRRETGAIPAEFEVGIPEVEIAGVKLRGTVDRVDRTPDGKQAWVIDYKSGGTREYEPIKKGDLLAGGKKLQLPVYLSAAGDAEVASAWYWFITRKSDFEFIGYHATPQNRALFERTLTTIVSGIRSGAFPAVPGEEDEYYGKFDNCKYCDFDRICSRRRDYELAAKRGDGALVPWLAVEQAAREGSNGD